MYTPNQEKLIQQQMEILGLSREEAIELIESDKKIDKGEKLFELADDLKAGAKKARQVTHHTIKSTAKREKKINNEKIEICESLMEGLKGMGVNDFSITNNEREFSFNFNGTKYKVVLSCPRS